MTRSALLACTAMALAVTPMISPAPLRAQPVVQAGAGQVLNVHNADIRAFIQDVARLTGYTFVIDPKVNGTVSVNTSGPLSRTELFEIFLSTLRANGVVAVPAGKNTYRIVPEEGVSRQPATSGGAGRFTTVVVRLNTLDATSAAETLRPLVSAQGQVLANSRSNTLVIADYGDNLQRLRKLLEEMDSDALKMETVVLSNSSARELSKVLRDLIQGPSGDPAAATVSVVPVDSSNAIVLRGPRAMVTRMAGLARDLDQRAESPEDVGLVFLKHANGAQLMPVLAQLLAAPPRIGQEGDNGSTAQVQRPTLNAESETPTTGQQTGLKAQAQPQSLSVSGPRGSVAYYGAANALIIHAEPSLQRSLTLLLRQLDVKREQVLVEAIVVEVSDTAARELGTQFIVSGTGKSTTPLIGNTGTTGSGINLANLAATAIASSQFPAGSSALAAIQQGGLTQIANSRGLVIGAGGQIGNDALFAMIINAVKADTDSNILSTPSVLTLANEKASLLVGQEVPITTGETLGNNNTNPFRTVTRQKVGVQLEVLPQINADGLITLHLRQEVSSVVGPVSQTSSELILSTREINTSVAVEDGSIIVLGGLLSDSDRRSSQKVPGLGEVPGLGALFSSKAKERIKTNLMVFIRPTIVRTGEDARAITAPRYDQIREAQARARNAEDRKSSQSTAREYDTLDDLIRDYMGATPPSSGQQPLSEPKTEN
ncbi:MAG: type II secretion system secretin GspD [Asticcacaulis sp.]